MNSRILIIFAALCLMATTALAESASDIRRRMEQRLTVIDHLKTEEAVGENNRGYLDLRPVAKGDAHTVVADENRDREAVYALIANQTGATADSVGRARAKQIAAGSRSGVWVQDENGSWRKK